MGCKFPAIQLMLKSQQYGGGIDIFDVAYVLVPPCVCVAQEGKKKNYYRSSGVESS